MPPPDPQKRYPHSLQRRFFLSLALFLMASMGLLGAALFVNQRDLMQERLARDTERLVQTLGDKGTASSTFLARIAPQGLLAYDYLLLEGYVEELSADPDIVYAVIFNPAGEPVTHYLNQADPYFADREVDPEHFSPLLDAARADSALMKVERDIDYEGTRLVASRLACPGQIRQRALELEINLENGTAYRSHYRRTAAGFAGGASSVDRTGIPASGGKTRAGAVRIHGQFADG
jgi:hypothetical protein